MIELNDNLDLADHQRLTALYKEAEKLGFWLVTKMKMTPEVTQEAVFRKVQEAYFEAGGKCRACVQKEYLNQASADQLEAARPGVYSHHGPHCKDKYKDKVK